jgi:hypothetical protein
MSTKLVKNEEKLLESKSAKSSRKSPKKSAVDEIAKLISLSAQETDIKLEEIVNFCKDKRCNVKSQG